MKVAAAASAMAMRKFAASACKLNSPGANAARKLSSAVRTYGNKASARGGVTPDGERVSRSSPIESFSRFSALLTAGWLIDSLSAARVRLRSAITERTLE